MAGKPNVARLEKQHLPADGTIALSAFHDQPVAIPSILNLIGGGSWAIPVAHLDVPAGKYVVVAKALVSGNFVYDEPRIVLCSLVAGADSDTGAATDQNTLALNVVHAFPNPGRIQLNCTRVTAATTMTLAHVKITAVRVATLKNSYVAVG